MDREQVAELMAHGVLPQGQIAEKLVETHISYVILCATRVYKIKKPVKLSFLDLSTLEKRKYFAGQELILNQRLCPAIYLRVLPVTLHEGRYHIGGKAGQVVDHALEMVRLDNALEMDHMLAKGLVTTADIDRVLQVLIPFHQGAQIIRGRVTAKDLLSDFADLGQILDFCAATLGEAQARVLQESISFVERYLTAHAKLIARRDREGFIRDVHGDLHAGNIFLTEEPILFDCIEFDPHFRQIDLLNELAFFAMELELAGYPDLSAHLMERYNSVFPLIRDREEEGLFLFYELYRTNVRMKVNAIRLQGTIEPKELAERRALLRDQFKLYVAYWEALKKMNGGS